MEKKDALIKQAIIGTIGGAGLGAGVGRLLAKIKSSKLPEKEKHKLILKYMRTGALVGGGLGVMADGAAVAGYIATKKLHKKYK